MTPAERKEAARQRARAYYAAHKDAIAAKRKLAYHTDAKERSKQLERARAWRAAHPEEDRARQRAAYQKKRDERLAYAKQFYQEHRDERLAYAKQYQREHLAEHRAASARYRKKDPAATKAYMRAYKRQHAERIRASGRKTYHRRADKAIEYQRQARAADPVKASARWAVQNALARGKLTKPDRCEACGTVTPSRRLHAHHHRGYDHPLDVQWLCSWCHGAEHRKE